MRQMVEFFKRETVLSVAGILAVLSMILVHPDADYAGYVDVKTLAMLFCLMLVMAGFQKLGIFARIGETLINHVSGEKGICAVLVFLCFFTSMFITNDVSLLTFVPFALTVLKLAGLEELVIPVVVLQTIAANLGSMMTPIGNPQNLYLYGQSGMENAAFILLMLPYAAAAFVLLACCVLLVKTERTGKKRKTERNREAERNYGATAGATEVAAGVRRRLFLYLILFICCIASVAHLIPWQLLLILVTAAVLISDRSLFVKVDYALLLTFVAFFVFIGNMGRIAFFYELLSRIVQGNEVIVSVLASQIISNVPAALLLSGFTDQWQGLIVGTNLGGLGTLIASMASLISYKKIVRSYPRQKGRYLVQFTAANIGFLIVLLIFWGCVK